MTDAAIIDLKPASNPPARTRPNRRRRFTPEQIDTALLALALAGGNSTIASERLALNGFNITADHLRQWKARDHRDRYNELAEKHGPELEALAVQRVRENVLQAADVAQLALEQTRDKLEAGEIKDPAKTFQNVQVGFGIGTEKLLLLTNRPNVITETRDAVDLLRTLGQRLGIPHDADSTADEIEAPRIPARVTQTAPKREVPAS